MDQADTGLAVPPYVWEAGVRSVADLDRNADKFERTIYGIEVGSGMHTRTEEMIANDVARAWIAANPETVATWFDGMKAVDGKPAFEAVRAAIR